VVVTPSPLFSLAVVFFNEEGAAAASGGGDDDHDDASVDSRREVIPCAFFCDFAPPVVRLALSFPVARPLLALFLGLVATSRPLSIGNGQATTKQGRPAAAKDLLFVMAENVGEQVTVTSSRLSKITMVSSFCGYLPVHSFEMTVRSLLFR
jgi:hypothetical protein